MLFTHGEKSEAKNKAMICKEEYFHEVEDFVVSNDNRKPKSDDQPPKTEDIAPETEDHTPDCDDQIPDSDEKPLKKESEDHLKMIIKQLKKTGFTVIYVIRRIQTNQY